MQILACPSCFRVFQSHFHIDYCPDCHSPSKYATSKQASAFTTYKQEHHFGPSGIRLDRYNILQQRKVDLEKELSETNQEIERLENFSKALDIGAI